MEACADTTASHEKWLTKLTISSWLTHVKEVLNCGCLVAQCVAQCAQCAFRPTALTRLSCVTAFAHLFIEIFDCLTSHAHHGNLD